MQSPSPTPDLAVLYARRERLLMEMYVAKGAYLRSRREDRVAREQFRARLWLVRDIDQEVRAAMGLVPLNREQIVAFRRAAKQRQNK